MNDLSQHDEIKTLAMLCDICVCKNIKTGKYFIVIDCSQDTVMTLVTPVSTILTLESNLFSEPEDMDENVLRETGLLSEEQLSAYYRYIEEYEEVLEKNATGTGFVHGSDEPEYVRTYRKMLNNADSMPSIMHRIVEERREIKWYELAEQLTKHGYVKNSGSRTASLNVLERDGYLKVKGTGDNKSISYVRAIERTVSEKIPHNKINELNKLIKRLTKEQREELFKEFTRTEQR